MIRAVENIENEDFSKVALSHGLTGKDFKYLISIICVCMCLPDYQCVFRQETLCNRGTEVNFTEDGFLKLIPQNLFDCVAEFNL